MIKDHTLKKIKLQEMRFNMVFKSKFTRGITAASLMAVLGMSLVTGVSADTGAVTKVNDVDLTINSSTVGNGGLDLATSPIAGFGAIELGSNPEVHNTSFTDKFTVTDLRGTQAGYALSVEASPFTNMGTGHALPNGSLTLDAVSTIERVGTGTGVLPVSQLTTTTAIDDGVIKVLNAPEGTGAGIFDVKFAADALGLTVDATTAKVGTYESTLTWNLNSTPSAN